VNEFESSKISKEEFKKLNEEDLMFITNPGRMGDEDGSTFVIKHGNDVSVYRIDGWMYPNPNEKEEYKISYGEMIKQFPKWKEMLNHASEKDYNGKYIYLYMGFGNGLCVDKSIYNEYVPYLNNLVKKYLDDKIGDKESLKYAAVFNVWGDAIVDMVNDKNSLLKK
jgi:hypothetical protein